MILGWSSAGSATSAKTIFFAGDVLFGKLRPNLKKAAAARFDGVCSTDILPLFGKDGLDSAYLLQLAQWDRFQQHAVATASGTKMPRTSWTHLGEFTFLCPPLNEQRTIAAVLSSIDDAIEKTQAVIDQVQVVKRGVMQELFTRGLPAGTDPSEWHQENIGYLFTLQLGKMLNKDARKTLPVFPYLGNKDVQWGRLDFSNLRKMHFNEEEREKFRLLPDDLLVCEGGEVGRTAIWTGKIDCYFQKAIHRLRVRSYEIVEPRFIMHFMRFAATNRLFTNLTSQSSFAHLTREKLALLKVWFPSLIEQRTISDVLSSIDELASGLEATIRQARVTKQSLMSVLLTGEVRVTVDTEAA